MYTLWVNIEVSMGAFILAMRAGNDLEEHRAKKQLALKYLDITQSVGSKLVDLKLAFDSTDFYYKIRIYKTWVVLNSSVTGDLLAVEDVALTEEDRETAAKLLGSIHEALLRKPISPYRKIQYKLATSDMYRRNFEVSQNIEHLKKACKLALKAQKKAKTCRFNNLSGYAAKRVEYLENEMKNVERNENTGNEY